MTGPHLEIVEADGGWSLREIAWKERAWCRDRAHVEAVAAMLRGEVGPAGEAAEVPEPAAPAPDQAPAVPADPTPASAAPEPAEADWDAALDRVAAGEKLKAVAEELGLPWAQLRGKWTVRRKAERAEAASRAAEGDPLDVPWKQIVPDRSLALRPAAAPVAQDDYVRPPAPAQGLWTDDEDVEIATAAEGDLLAVAEKLGRSLADVTRRRARLEAEAAREMSK
jgi:hypothetical protein